MERNSAAWQSCCQQTFLRIALGKGRKSGHRLVNECNGDLTPPDDQATSLGQAGEHVLSRDEYVRVDVVAQELKAASSFSPRECFDGVTLIERAFIGNSDGCA